MRQRLTASVAGFLVFIASATPALAIVYGSPTGNLYPHVGALIDEFDVDGVPTKFSVCTGTLIDDGDGDGTSNLFLTAAHCIFSEDVWVSFAAVVPTDPETQAVLPEAQLIAGKATPHERFACCGANDTYDIAMVELQTSVAITPATVIGPGALSDMTKQELRSETFTAVGYGGVRDSNRQAWAGIEPAFGVRSYAEQSVLALTKAWLTLSMNLATGDGGTCYGDSGGPHFMEDGTLASITVTGDAVCKATDQTYRLDTPVAQEFLGRYVGD